MKKAFPIPVRVKYSCAKCPAYCCSYPEIEATPRDIQRLARHFGLGYAQAEERFTRRDPAAHLRLLRHGRVRIAGLPEAQARSNAGAKSSVRSATSPCAPNARAYAAKSGFLSSVPNTRPGYSRSWCMRIVP